MRRNRIDSRREERGNVLAFVTIALVALLAFAAWSTETGQAWTAKGQLQGASDSAALAGAGDLLEPNGGQQADPPAAIASAQDFGAQNKSIGVPITIPAGDIETGSWDKTNRVFTPMPGSTDPTQVRAVRVLGRRDATANGPVPTVLGRIFGVDSIPVAATATAYIGFAGLIPAGGAVLPIALSCCQIASAACEQSYCPSAVDNPPNQHALESGPYEGTMVTQFDFQSTPEQNACWTGMDPNNPAVSANKMRDIVVDGNPIPIGEEPIYIDNGTKTPIVGEIYNRFHKLENYANQDDGQMDIDNDGLSDSWLVALPIIECQNPGPGCSGGTPQVIKGVACFDIQEVIVTPDKIIRGTYVCPGDDRWDDSICDQGFGPGGDVPTIDAQYPVLVQ